jgi:murein DD-endopeptidase MepM/ murein hydrolase activator NlpD
VLLVVGVISAVAVPPLLPPASAEDGSNLHAADTGPARVSAPSTPNPRSPAVGEQRVPKPPAAMPRVPLLRAPVDGPLLRGFEEPAGPYGPGHRGVDFGAAPGSPVRAPASGRVTFAGRAVGTTWVTIEVAPTVLVTLGPLQRVATSVGRAVTAGGPIGTLAPGHPLVDPAPVPGQGPSPASASDLAALHLGLRVNGVYVDPLPWLAGLARPRLAPLAEPGGPH